MTVNHPPADHASGDTMRRILNATRSVIRHTAATISWFSQVWFNLTLPLAILLAGIAVMSGMVLMGLMVGITPDHVDTVSEFGQWLTNKDHHLAPSAHH